jgi:Tol biopolymer transport system component
VGRQNIKQQVFSLFDPVQGRRKELARLDAGDRFFWALSPDGSEIAITEGESLRLLDVQNRNIREVVLKPSRAWLHRAASSSDGDKLFVPSTEPSAKGKILVIELDGRNHVLLENKAPCWMGAPIVSPDGKQLAYAETGYESNVTLFEHF